METHFFEKRVNSMKTGLLSVTFRKLSPDHIIRLVSQAGLQVIEWGGDIHVPHGDIEIAEQVGRMTREAGIEVASYGSYYSLRKRPEKLHFEDVLKSACALKAPSIRVWAGNRASADATPEWRREITMDARRIADLAQAHGITIDFEYHNGTLTDNIESAVSLMQSINHPNVRCNWQTPVPGNYDTSISSLLDIRPWLANVHVFHMLGKERQCLSAGKSDWLEYMSVIRKTGKTPNMMLEFVKNDDPTQFLEDAGALSDIVTEEHGGILNTGSDTRNK
jgi:3-dehydroshikimate dehydratase